VEFEGGFVREGLEAVDFERFEVHGADRLVVRLGGKSSVVRLVRGGGAGNDRDETRLDVVLFPAFQYHMWSFVKIRMGEVNCG
jgi:hypothetical protein